MAQWLDAFLGAVWPALELQRAQTRLKTRQFEQATMAYDGATTGRRSQGWRVVSTDANTELLGTTQRIRDVARDMVRNNAHASRARQVIIHNAIGTGIIPNIVAKRDGVRTKLEDLLKAHFDTTACDTEGRHDLYGLQALAMGTIVESGEVLIRLRPRLAKDKLPLPFQLQVMEPDYLDSSVNGPQANGNNAAQGIEYNLLGQIVAYHLFKQHPGSSSSYSLPQSSRITADFVAHGFATGRPGQARGVSWFAPVIVRMRDLAEFSDAQLMRQKIAACFAAFIRSDEAPENSVAADKKGKIYATETLSPGMIERLKDGEEVSFGTPPVVGDYDPYMKAVLREIAAGLGLSYEALTGDLSGVNFSSGRMGWLEFQRTIDGWRNYMLIPQLLTKIGGWFLDAAALETGRRGDATVMWTAPRREMISPNTEVPAIKDAIRAGLTSRSNEQRKLGFDPEDLESEIAEDNKRADAAGLVFDTDPRKVTAAGQAADALQAAVNLNNRDKN